MGARVKLGELLLRAGVITEQQLRTALSEQKKWGGKLGSILVELGYIDEDILVKALSRQLGLPRVDFAGLVVSPEALSKIDRDYAEKKQVLPIAYDPGKKLLVVAAADPLNMDTLNEISFSTGCRVRTAIAGEKALERAIRRYYFGEEVEHAAVAAHDETSSVPVGERQLDASDLSLVDRVEEIEKMQRRQLGLLKLMVELLLKKGLITKEEYRRTLQGS
ncbi:MAG: hypothetical protein D6806_08555 [Deltaproteobacteria bacterium]|nr:MAG: hypothetical protein D6806_08555 [Deltaproteobacteria bacterium]